MIQVGIMAATSSINHPFSVVLKVNPRTPIAYFVGNPKDFPEHVLFELNCGEKVAGVFDFAPEDQFAYYVPIEKVKITT